MQAIILTIVSNFMRYVCEECSEFKFSFANSSSASTHVLGTTIMICLRATLRSLGMFVHYTVTCLRAKTHVSTSRLAREKFTKVESKIRDSIQKNDQTHHGAITITIPHTLWFSSVDCTTIVKFSNFHRWSNQGKPQPSRHLRRLRTVVKWREKCVCVCVCVRERERKREDLFCSFFMRTVLESEDFLHTKSNIYHLL